MIALARCGGLRWIKFAPKNKRASPALFPPPVGGDNVPWGELFDQSRAISHSALDAGDDVGLSLMAVAVCGCQIGRHFCRPIS